ncbi:CmcI family methyltransferase [Acidovorax sp. sic0104]|uniref:CmcI family methyltransferase n=1 Tax=Acidovorax sp. sic0104 TaxID=2854784 RepID=UPI001C44DBE0|nr:CmcI family methyltransferase [Acidovorax sp. sic0104]MBV7540386.1 cephalosporin hydroxylase family protein [Acidovorax sp. sic0104]
MLNSLPMEECLDSPLGKVLPALQQGIMDHTTYFGIRTLKNPLDAWVYQEIIFASRPDVIVEIGNFHGGHLLALAHLCDAMGHGRVIGVDLSHQWVPPVVREHPRVTLVQGDACASYERVEAVIAADEQVLLIEDSAHTFEHTLQVLRQYALLVKPGGYFIVEDSVCHHGLDVGPQPGPYEAIEAFLQENPWFESDRSREHFLVTWNPRGYLRRKEAPG